jgi:hypothetical protein
MFSRLYLPRASIVPLGCFHTKIAILRANLEEMEIFETFLVLTSTAKGFDASVVVTAVIKLEIVQRNLPIKVVARSHFLMAFVELVDFICAMVMEIVLDKPYLCFITTAQKNKPWIPRGGEPINATPDCAMYSILCYKLHIHIWMVITVYLSKQANITYSFCSKPGLYEFRRRLLPDWSRRSCRLCASYCFFRNATNYW